MLKSKKGIASILAVCALFILFFTTTGETAGNNDLQKQLKELKRQRLALDKKIAALEAQTGKNPGSASYADEKPAYVGTEKIHKRAFKHYTRVQGVVESDYNILMATKNEGIVENVYVEKGDSVKKGQILAKLDNRIIRSTIDEVKTSLELASSIYQRRKRLWDKKIGSEVDFLTAKNNMDSLRKKLVTLNEQLADTRIVSPINGRIDDVLIKEGEFAPKKAKVFRVFRLDDMKINVSVSERYASRLKKGASVQVNLTGSVEGFNSTIRSVARVIDPVNRTLSFEVEVPKNRMDLKPNMLVEVVINDYSADALTVPVNVVQKTGGEPFLFVLSAEKKGSDSFLKVRKCFVRTGYYYKDRLEILQGLEPGDEVVVEGYQDLSNGQAVEIKSS